MESAKTPREELLAVKQRFEGLRVDIGYKPHQGKREKERRARKLRRVSKDGNI